MLPTTSLPPGTIVGGDFRIERPLGRGGMGTVYLATQLSTQRERALKVLHAAFVTDAATRKRFIQEAQIGARIRSDHIVEVVAAGFDRDTQVPWLAMELLEGEDLGARIARDGPFEATALRPLMAQLRHALEPAHANGIVHRDLKPENLFLCRPRRHDSTVTLKVLDFGIAKSLAETHGSGTATAAMGSPRFMAPEQTREGGDIQPATDVWAIGLIAFFALTGRHYWRSANANNLQAIFAELLVDTIEPASRRAHAFGLSARLPASFDDWFAGCVDRDPSRRFRGASACLRALDSALSGTTNVPADAFAATEAVAAVAPPVTTPVQNGPPPLAPTQPMQEPQPVAPAPAASPPSPPARRSGSGALLVLGSGAFVAAAVVAAVSGVALWRDFRASSGPTASQPSVDRGAQPSTGPMPTADRRTFADVLVDPDGAPASLQLTSPDPSPGFRVRVDDEPIGVPPLQIAVRPGVHFVELIHDNGDIIYDWFGAYEGQTRQVSLRAFRRPPVADRIPPGHGALAIGIDPDVIVQLDGQPYDAVQARPVVVGSHQVRLAAREDRTRIEVIDIEIREGAWVGIRRYRRSLGRPR